MRPFRDGVMVNEGQFPGYPVGTLVMFQPCQGNQRDSDAGSTGTIIEAQHVHLIGETETRIPAYMTCYGVELSTHRIYVCHCCLRRLVTPGLMVEEEATELEKV